MATPPLTCLADTVTIRPEKRTLPVRRRQIGNVLSAAWKNSSAVLTVRHTACPKEYWAQISRIFSLHLPRLVKRTRFTVNQASADLNFYFTIASICYDWHPVSRFK